jgi:hypothetical protein
MCCIGLWEGLRKEADAGGLEANLAELAIKAIEGFCEDGRKGGFG